MKIFIAVTHLLGIGHFARMRILARGLVAHGHHVVLVAGGRPAPHLDVTGIEYVQLPPVHCVGTDFRTLYQADDIVLTDDIRAQRRALLLKTLADFQPDLVVTETFPFGRRALKDEFLALCEAAAALRPRPALVASIRDILNPPSSIAKAHEADRVIGEFYDGILVHGDARFVRPQSAWPFGPRTEALLHLTGYMDESAPVHSPAQKNDTILVSGGGSAASLPLYRTAITLAANRPERPWHILVGHGVSHIDFDELVRLAPSHVQVERARPDFRALLQRAALSISQAGYNTIVDLLTCTATMILVPFSSGQEQEQTLRAQALAEKGLAVLVPEDELNPASLQQAIDRALALPARDHSLIACDGVAGSVSALLSLADKRQEIESAWAELAALLASIHARHDHVSIWWRDDDAIAPSLALEHLLQLSKRYQAPLALAVIPQQVDPALVSFLQGTDCDIVVHGIAHKNHAPQDHKKQELGFQPLDDLIAALQHSRNQLQNLFGPRALPVLVPPWNRIDPALIPQLPALGFTGLSTFKPRLAEEAAPGLRQINTHCDPVDWRQGGQLRPEAALVRELTAQLARLSQTPPAQREPFGLLTHHLIHDDAIWAFLDRLFHTLAISGAVNFVGARDIFDQSQILSPRDRVK
jgi:predicted glycosyltransferase